MTDDSQQVEEVTGWGLTVRAVVTRKDGTVEDLGIISEGRVGFEVSTDPS